MKQEVSESAKNVKVDRKAFGAAITKLLQASPITKPEMSKRVKIAARQRRFLKPLPGSR